MDRIGDINQEDVKGNSALSVTFSCGNKKAEEIINNRCGIKNKKFLELEKKKSQKPEQETTRHVNKLIEQENDGETALHVAAASGDIEKLKKIIEHGTNVNAQNKDGWTPLHITAQKGHTEVVKYLIENGADVNAPDKNGQTSLHIANVHQQLEVVNILISTKGIDINAKDNNGRSPRKLKEECDKTKSAQQLITKVADDQDQEDLTSRESLSNDELNTVTKVLKNSQIQTSIEEFKTFDNIKRQLLFIQLWKKKIMKK